MHKFHHELLSSLRQKVIDNNEKHINQVISGYESVFGKIDYRTLQNMLELWGVRGIVQLLLNQKEEKFNSELLSKMIEVHDEICAFTNERIDTNINI
jgi:hypothetical protein